MRTVAILSVMVLFTLSVHAAVKPLDVLSSVKGLTEAQFDGEIKRYFNRTTEEFKQRYLYEANLAIDLSLFDYNRTVVLLCRGELNAGLGNSPFGLALHPYSMNFAVNPVLEYRRPEFHTSVGIDHRCFHYIDQRPPLPIVYWNRCFIMVNSPDRRAVQRSTVLLDTCGHLLRHFSWSGAWGYYVSEFFDVISPINLMSLTRPYYLHQFDASVRYGFASWRGGLVEATSKSMLGFRRSGKGNGYWAEEFGIEALFVKREYDVSTFVRFTTDGGRFDSKDRLFEFGIKAHK